MIRRQHCIRVLYVLYIIYTAYANYVCNIIHVNMLAYPIFCILMNLKCAYAKLIAHSKVKAHALVIFRLPLQFPDYHTEIPVAPCA